MIAKVLIPAPAGYPLPLLMAHLSVRQPVVMQISKKQQHFPVSCRLHWRQLWISDYMRQFQWSAHSWVWAHCLHLGLSQTLPQHLQNLNFLSVTMVSSLGISVGLECLQAPSTEIPLWVITRFIKRLLDKFQSSSYSPFSQELLGHSPVEKQLASSVKWGA